MRLQYLFIAFLLLASCDRTRYPCAYLIPEGFTGWVLIEYNISPYPTLPTKDGKVILRVGSDGRLFTSSNLETGWAKDEFYYVNHVYKELPVSNFGGGGLIWGMSTGFGQVGHSSGINYECFFVGTEDQFKKAGERPRPDGLRLQP